MNNTPICNGNTGEVDDRDKSVKERMFSICDVMVDILTSVTLIDSSIFGTELRDDPRAPRTNPPAETPILALMEEQQRMVFQILDIVMRIRNGLG